MVVKRILPDYQKSINQKKFAMYKVNIQLLSKLNSFVKQFLKKMNMQCFNSKIAKNNK